MRSAFLLRAYVFIVVAVLVACGVCAGGAASADGKAGKLRFNEDGRFRIVQFTDIHWKAGEEDDQKSIALMGTVLDIEKPDLVVLTGDILGGGKCKAPGAGLQACAAPMIERGIPWALAFGNHDDESTMSRDELMKLARSLPYGVSQRGPRDITGVSNYVLPVRASKGRKQAATIYCIDSNSYYYVGEERDGYDWIHPDQIHWYLKKAEGIRKRSGGELLPALAFFHIPIPEYKDVWDAGGCVGSKYEDVCSPKVNSGFFAALFEAGDVMGTFVGHDHVNDYEGALRGIRAVLRPGQRVPRLRARGIPARGAGDRAYRGAARLCHLAPS